VCRYVIIFYYSPVLLYVAGWVVLRWAQSPGRLTPPSGSRLILHFVPTNSFCSTISSIPMYFLFPPFAFLLPNSPMLYWQTMAYLLRVFFKMSFVKIVSCGRGAAGVNLIFRLFLLSSCFHGCSNNRASV
jgi:hypothetical protein